MNNRLEVENPENPGQSGFGMKKGSLFNLDVDEGIVKNSQGSSIGLIEVFKTKSIGYLRNDQLDMNNLD